jgi:acyl-CoA synthetase (AMP-forming)/AMP-acid ligase II
VTPAAPPAPASAGADSAPPGALRVSADTLIDVVDAVVSHHGDHEAYVECRGVRADGLPEVRRLTFAGWARAADAWACRMLADGVRPGDVVAITLPSGIDYAIAYQSVVRCGAIATGINPRLGPAECAHILGATHPALVVEAAPDDIAAASGDADHLDGDPFRRHADASSSDPVAIVWTGGTTGLPKGAVFDHQCLATVAEGSGPLSQLGDRRLSPLPFSHVGTMTRLWDELVHLVTTVITPTPWTPAATAALLLHERISVCQGVPTQYALLCDHLEAAGIGPDALPHLRLAGIGGARIPPELVVRMGQRLGAPVVVRYASTEASLATGTQPGDSLEVVTSTVGRPSGAVQLKIIDDNGVRLPAGAGNVGTVCLRSRAQMRGYYRDLDRTAEAIDPDGWLHTGDLGWVGTDGNLRLVGRHTELYIRGGYNVYPAEVENVLGALPSVAAAAVVGATTDRSTLGELGIAFVVPADANQPPSLASLRQEVSARLADYKAPDALVLVDALPLTTIGKIDKRALQGRADEEASTWTRPDRSGRPA